MDTFDILVIVLSVLLGIFLISSIIVTVVIYKVVQSIRHIVAKGEHVIDSAEAAADMVKKAAGPLGALKMLMNVVETVSKHNKKG